MEKEEKNHPQRIQTQEKQFKVQPTFPSPRSPPRTNKPPLTELGGGLQITTTAEHSWSYTKDQNSPKVLCSGHSVTMYSRGFV